MMTANTLTALLSGDYDLETEAEIGRRGTATATSVSLELNEFAGNNTTFHAATGYEFRPAAALTKLRAGAAPGDIQLAPLLVSEQLSNESQKFKGNRHFIASALPPGLYTATDVLGASNRRSTERIALTPGGATVIAEGDFHAYARKLFADSYAAALNQIEQFRDNAFRAERLFSELAQLPALSTEQHAEFAVEVRVAPSREQIYRAATELQHADEVIKSRQHANINYRITLESGAVIDADCASAAVGQARSRVARLAAEAAKDLIQLPALGELKGTAKQIVWANSIRELFQRNNPGHVSLKRATTAKFWIDNYR